MSEGTIEDVLEGKARWCVVEGDAREVLPTIPDGAAHHCITDPPYSEHVHRKSRAGARKTPLRDGNGRLSRCAIDREVDFGFASLATDVMKAVADQCARIAARWSMAFCDVESSHLWRAAFASAGLDYCRTGAWIKIGATPQFTGDRPGVGFETIVIAHQPGRKRWNGGGALGVWPHCTAIDRGGAAARGTEIATSTTRLHPTQKPLSLMLDLVGLFTDPDDIIVDPFFGSGTTGVAALRLGRRFIGIEREARWAELSRERLRAEDRNSTLQAVRAGQTSLFDKVPA